MTRERIDIGITLRGLPLYATKPHQYRHFHEVWIATDTLDLTNWPGIVRLDTPDRFADDGRRLAAAATFYVRTENDQYLSPEVRVWRDADGTAQGYCDWIGRLTSVEAEAILAAQAPLDAADPFLAEQRRHTLPCSERGYHRDEVYGGRITPDQIGKYVLSWCRDCGEDLYPNATEARREATTATYHDAVVSGSRDLAALEG